jgi:DNA-binding NarL/FixJ family response regulator
VVVAKDPLVRSGLAAVLSVYPGLVLKEALATAGGAPAADVLVWDEPEKDHATLGAGVLALVSDAPEARLALRAGARGALSRSAPPSAIAPAALAVAAGHWVVDERFAREILQLGDPPAPSVALSPREQEVLELMSEGLSNGEIAARLGISRHTAKFHVNAILDKLGATTRTEAVVLAARGGILTL